MKRVNKYGNFKFSLKKNKYYRRQVIGRVISKRNNFKLKRAKCGWAYLKNRILEMGKYYGRITVKYEQGVETEGDRGFARNIYCVVCGYVDEKAGIKRHIYLKHLFNQETYELSCPYSPPTVWGRSGLSARIYLNITGPFIKQ